MLDIFLMAFVLGAFACLLVDRDQARARLARIDADGARPRPPNGAGPHLGLRWWRMAAGLCLGADRRPGRSAGRGLPTGLVGMVRHLERLGPALGRGPERRVRLRAGGAAILVAL